VVVAIAAVTMAAGGQVGAQEAWYPYPVEIWDPPFDMSSPRTEAEYVPLEKASRKWNIHVFFPHMKDVFWLAVNHGVASEARRLGVQMMLKHAGGYDKLDVQIRQIRESIALKPDGIILAAISYTGLDSIITEIREAGIPVIDVVNGVSSKEITAKSLVSYGDMGYLAGEYLARRHPKGSEKVKVAWFPGPEAAGWVQDGDKGFKEAAGEGAIEVVATRYGDTGKATQRKLVDEVIETHPDIDYVVGTTVTAEATPRILRKRGLTDQVKIISYYLSPGVYRGIKRGQILAAPVDPSVIQGRIAMDQLVRILDGKPYEKHVGPRIQVLDTSNIDAFDTSPALAPSGFRATYSVN
jgi:protein TorT